MEWRSLSHSARGGVIGEAPGRAARRIAIVVDRARVRVASPGDEHEQREKSGVGALKLISKSGQPEDGARCHV
jgi:hypothetical protein